MNLQKKAILIVVAILLFALGVNTGVLTFIATNKYKDAIISKTSVVGENTQKELENILALGVPLESFEDLSETLHQLINQNDILGYAMIMGIKGKILFHSNADVTGEILGDEASLKISASRESLVQTVKPHYDLSFPLFDADDNLVGALRVGVKIRAIQSQLYKLLFWALGISVMSFLVTLAIVYILISRFITKPVMNMENVAESMASGDLTALIDINGEGEVASLGNAINKISLNLKDMILKIGYITESVSSVTTNVFASSNDIMNIATMQKNSVDETAVSTETLNNSITGVAKSADSLFDSSENTSSAIAQMMKSMWNVSESANVLDTSAKNTASSVQNMVFSIKQISESLQNLSKSSEEISSSAFEVNTHVKEIENRANESVVLAEDVTRNASEKGLSAVKDAMRGMEDIKNNVSALSDVINLLGKRSGEIEKILSVINDVTDQTSLLSLNAAIIAAQAGEDGRAFAVVADEIRTLAERTSLSTREIEDLIRAVQKETGSSVQMAAKGIEAADRGLELVSNVNEALTDIVESSGASTDMSKAIQKATSEQAQGIVHITEAIRNMTGQVEQISHAIQEQDKGSRLIIDSAEKMKEMSHQITVATSDQKQGSKQITDAIDNVTQQADQIAKSTNDQKQGSEEIVRSMGDVKETTVKLRDFSKEMNDTINSLKDESKNLISELQKFKI
jgi:methyl-accepting chemotaxis protein